MSNGKSAKWFHGTGSGIIITLVGLILLSACGKTPIEPITPKPQTLSIMAASSLTEVFTDLGSQFESLHAGVKIEFNFAGSQQLAQQLSNGARADAFASAIQKQMDAAIQAGRVNAQDAASFAKNSLVVINPLDNPRNIHSLADLASPGIKILLAAPEVPVGQYTLEFLDKASANPMYGADYKNRVLANVVSYETTVKAVVVKVGLGEVDAGIVYTTDLNQASLAKLGKIEIPAELNVIAEYYIAPIADGNTGLADQWIEFLRSSAGQDGLAKYGFLPIP